MNIKWRFILSKGWKITLTGLLIAVGIVLFPQAQCAVAQTCDGPRDKWCGSGKCCGPTNGYSAVTMCLRSAPISQPGVCIERGPGFTEPEVSVRCTNASDCSVNEVLGSPNRLSGGYWAVGACPKYSVKAGEACGSPDTSKNRVRATCCSGSSGSGGGCTPSYAAPTIDDTYTVDPPNPVVWTQEQPPYGEALGMTVNDIQAHGGSDTACQTGRANITSLTVYLQLRQSSIDWIENELSRRYIGARVKDTYPKYPEWAPPFHKYVQCAWTPGTSGINTADARLDCRFFRPWDPGYYDVVVTACQSDGQCTTKTLPEPISVWLMETRLAPPWTP